VLSSIHTLFTRYVETWLRIRRIPLGERLAGGEYRGAGDGRGGGRDGRGQGDEQRRHQHHGGNHGHRPGSFGPGSQPHQASESAGSTAGYSQDSEAEESEDEDNSEPGQVNLGSAYAQCKAAPEAANRRIVVDISCNENAMVSSTLGGDRVGSMDRGIDKSIENCFKGACIKKNGVLVNQYLSCSFDPATLVCITCENEHKLLEGGEGKEC
jgi:hypothetical protein